MTRTPEYEAYLDSDEWGAFRARVIRYRRNKCQKCGADGRNEILHCHHLTYKRIFEERLKDVELLCVPCHRKADAKRKKR